MEKAIFFDRDGTLVKPKTYGSEKNVAPRKPEDLKLYPSVKRIIKQLNKKGFIIIVVSNQPDIALLKINEKTKFALEKRFEELLEQESIKFDRIYYCHHHPDSVNPDYPKDCDCRKPKPGMILKAAQKWNIDLAKSWVIGDRDGDILAGQAAGCNTILIKRPQSNENSQPDYTIDNLLEVVTIITKS